jgi:hypothetical protein
MASGMAKSSWREPPAGMASFEPTGNEVGVRGNSVSNKYASQRYGTIRPGKHPPRDVRLTTLSAEGAGPLEQFHSAG